jgi:hypothetical protein
MPTGKKPPKKKPKQHRKPLVRKFPPAKPGDFIHPDPASIPAKPRRTGLLRSTQDGARTMKKLSLIFLLLASPCFGQNWSNFLDPSRAIDWRSGVGFTIPSYTTACPTQPTLQPGSSNAAANASAIQTALASCTSTRNVVNLRSGTYYVTNFNFGSKGHQVLRGAGPNSTYIYIIASSGSLCNGYGGAVCMTSGSAYYDGSAAVLPGGSNACSWTAGYAQGTTSITLSGCGGRPPVNQTIILDQANDTSDTGGVFVCDDSAPGYTCTYKGNGAGNKNGRVINGVTHSQKQVVYVTRVTSLGGGSYTVTITPGIYFTNIRSGQSPGAWWPGFVQNDGLENLTVDYSQSTAGATNAAAISMYNCYQCWVKNIRSIDSGRNHVYLNQSANDIIRDSYFYQSQSHSSVSYGVEPEGASASLVENNIFQQVTCPIMAGQCSGCVFGYNFGPDNIFTTPPTYLLSTFAGHNAGNQFDLYEGNIFSWIWVDDAWGSSDQTTMFRNSLPGWQNGKTSGTIPLLIRAWNRDYNYIGNILGQPSYHNAYQVYATSGRGGVNLGNESTAIYSIGTAIGGGLCTPQQPACDALSWTTLMRWGNYDTVNGATQWNATEASSTANTYVNANFTSSYFSSLSHMLPASLYYNAAPSWWPTGKNWPPIGPDLSSGNVGTCSTGSTYAGAQATSSSQCTGGTLNSAWASHVTSIPAQDCFLRTMGGPPDGSGSVLSFDASVCYDHRGSLPSRQD